MAPLSEGGAGVSKEEAVKIIESEMENYLLAQSIARDEGLEAEIDLWTGQVVAGLSILPRARFSYS